MNHYQVLGIPQSATQAQVKTAYLKMAKKYHPDSSATGCAESFKIVNHAYQTLFDNGKRTSYDSTVLRSHHHHHHETSYSSTSSHYQQQQHQSSSGNSSNAHQTKTHYYYYEETSYQTHRHRTKEDIEAEEEFRRVYQEYVDRYKNVFKMHEHMRKNESAHYTRNRTEMDQRDVLNMMAARKTMLVYVWACFFAICFPIFAFKYWRKRVRRLP